MQCSAETCDRNVKHRDMCSKHYQRWLKYGTVVARPAARKSVEERLWQRTERDSGCWLWTGYIRRNGYGSVKFEGRMRGAHQVAWIVTNGAIPDGQEIDHLCHVRHCINPDHLRAVSRRENAQNRRGANPNSTTGVRGVSRNASGSFYVRVFRKYVGTYATLAQAEAAASAARAVSMPFSVADTMKESVL